MTHPGQHILDTLTGDGGKMTALSLEAWYQEYCAKRKAMGVTVNFKEIKSAVTWLHFNCLKAIAVSPHVSTGD